MAPRARRAEAATMASDETVPADEAAERVGDGEMDARTPVATPAPPTLAEAFEVLAQAVQAQCEDNLPVWTHLQEVRGWHMNGNVGVSWRHLLLALEGVIGENIRS